MVWFRAKELLLPPNRVLIIPERQDASERLRARLRVLRWLSAYHLTIQLVRRDLELLVVVVIVRVGAREAGTCTAAIITITAVATDRNRRAVFRRAIPVTCIVEEQVLLGVGRRHLVQTEVGNPAQRVVTQFSLVQYHFIFAPSWLSETEQVIVGFVLHNGSAHFFIT